MCTGIRDEGIFNIAEFLFYLRMLNGHAFHFPFFFGRAHAQNIAFEYTG
jgi:hypothetical protein